jgi:ketosteroid isomerase-like protein
MTDREAHIRRLFALFDARDWDALVEFIHPDAVIVTDISRLAGEPYVGQEGFRRWTEELAELFADWRSELGTLEERENGTVFVTGSLYMRGLGSGAEATAPCAWIIDFDGDAIRRLELFPNRVEEARSILH